MPDFVALGEELKLSAKVTGRGSESIKSFKFLFKRADGKQVGSADGEISEPDEDGRVGTGTWEATGLEDEEMNCRVLWEAKADDLPAFGRGELVVYRSSIEVVTKDADGAPVTKAMVHVSVAPDSLYTAPCKTGSTRRTDDDGKVTFDDLPPGDVSVSIRTPYKLLEWVEDTGPTREAKVDKSYSACLVWPDPRELGDEPHKQYVNLPEDPSNPEQGRVIKIRTMVDTSTTPGGGISGDKIYLKVKWADDNSDLSEPTPGIDGNVGTKGKGPFVVEKALTSDGGEAVFELDLGRAGGDVVEVSVGGDEACTDAKFEIVNWRKLWLKPVKVPSFALPNNQLPDDMKEKINETLLPVFIECAFEDAYLLDDSRSFVVDQQRAATLGMRNADKAPFCFFEHDAPEKAHYDKIANDNPLRLWWLMAHVLYKHKDENFVIQMKGRTSDWQTSPSGNGFLPICPDGDPVLKNWRDYRAPEKHSGSGRMKPAVPAQASYWSREGSFGADGDIDIGYLDFDSSGQKFRVVLPKSTGVGSRTKVTCYVRMQTFSYGGGSSTKHWVTGTVSKTKLLSSVFTILHELGHSLHHTVRTNQGAPGLPAEHPHYYTGKGHSGPHCNYGLGPRDRAKDDYNALVRKGTHGTCIMFGGVGPKTKYASAMKFCPHCEPFVKALKMERL